MSTMPPLERVTFTGNHVHLEPLALAQAEALAAISNDPDLWQYMSSVNLGTPEAMHAWVTANATQPDRGEGLPFVMIDLQSGRVAGSTSLYDVNHRHQRAELGLTWLGKEFQRTALNTEAKLLLLTHAFDTLNFRRVHLKANVQNERSRRAIERIGAQFEGVLRNYSVMPDGTSANIAMYSITREEWPEVKEGLQGRLR